MAARNQTEKRSYALFYLPSVDIGRFWERLAKAYAASRAPTILDPVRTRFLTTHCDLIRPGLLKRRRMKSSSSSQKNIKNVFFLNNKKQERQQVQQQSSKKKKKSISNFDIFLKKKKK